MEDLPDGKREEALQVLQDREGDQPLGVVLDWNDHSSISLKWFSIIRKFIRSCSYLSRDYGWAMVVLKVFHLPTSFDYLIL